MKTYVEQVYDITFIDKNKREMKAFNLFSLLEDLLLEGKYTCDDILKIERHIGKEGLI